MKPMCPIKNERGALVVVVLTILAVIVIAAVLAMQLMLGKSKPLPAPAPAVVERKIPPMPKAEPQKAESLQTTDEAKGTVETPSDQRHDVSTPAEAEAESPAAQSSPANASGAGATASAQPSATGAADLESPPANEGPQKADATRPAQEKTEVAPERETFADQGKSDQTATVGAAKAVPPGAASKSAKDLVKSAAPAVAAANEAQPPAAEDRPKATEAAAAPDNEDLFTVQIGAFHHKAYADADVQKMKGLGYPAYIFKLMDKQQRPLYLVCFGRFRTLAEASDAMAAFKDKEKLPAVVARPGI